MATLSDVAPDVPTAEGDLVYVPDHDARLRARLPVQYRRPRIEALRDAIAARVQEVEDEIVDVLVSTALDTATHDALAQWGALLGAPRHGLDDTSYRAAIRAAGVANLAVGDRDTLLHVAEILAAPATVDLVDTPPASYTLTIYRETSLPDVRARYVGRVLDTITPGGVGSTVIEAPAGYFGFAEDPDALGYDVGIFARLL